MSSEAAKSDTRSRSPAERMRLYRQHLRTGMRCVSVLLHVTEIEVLVRKGYLKNEFRKDPSAIQFAINSFVDDALNE